MELLDWIGLFFALTPIWAALVYGLLRLIGRMPPPDGLPPGRIGGMPSHPRFGGRPRDGGEDTTR